jgi:dsDNA-specific endonuclease/ATPase MutS2
MSQEPITITYSLEEVLKEIKQELNQLNQKIDNNHREVNQKIDSNHKEVNQKIDSNQKEFNQKIDSYQQEINQKLDKQSQEIVAIKATLEAQQPLIQKMPDLAEKVGELKNWRQIVIIALTAFISGAITWVVRGGNFNP